MRKATILMLFAMLGAMLPVSVVGGICASLPCCSHEEQQMETIDAVNCCNSVACADTSAPESNGVSTSVVQQPSLTTPAAEIVFVLTAPAPHSSPAATLTTHQRLTLFSTLLI